MIIDGTDCRQKHGATGNYQKKPYHMDNRAEVHYALPEMMLKNIQRPMHLRHGQYPTNHKLN
jgi:hypothetical protein